MLYHLRYTDQPVSAVQEKKKIGILRTTRNIWAGQNAEFEYIKAGGTSSL
jgi:hypothetical protein